MELRLGEAAFVERLCLASCEPGSQEQPPAPELAVTGTDMVGKAEGKVHKYGSCPKGHGHLMPWVYQSGAKRGKPYLFLGKKMY